MTDSHGRHDTKVKWWPRSLVRQDVEADFHKLEAMVSDLTNQSKMVSDLTKQSKPVEPAVFSILDKQIKELADSLSQRLPLGDYYYYYSRLQTVNAQIIQIAPIDWLYEVWRALDIRTKVSGSSENIAIKQNQSDLNTAFLSLGYIPLNADRSKEKLQKNFGSAIKGKRKNRAHAVIKGSLSSLRKHLDADALSGVWQAMAINRALLVVSLWMVIILSALILGAFAVVAPNYLNVIQILVFVPIAMLGAAVSSVSTIAFSRGSGLPLVSKPRHLGVRILIGAAAGVFAYFLWQSKFISINGVDTNLNEVISVWYMIAFALGFSERAFSSAITQFATSVEQRVEAAVGVEMPAPANKRNSTANVRGR